VEIKIFFQARLDRANQIDPAQQFSLSAQAVGAQERCQRSAVAGCMTDVNRCNPTDVRSRQ